MTTSRIKRTYYNGVSWRTELLADGTRVVQPMRIDGTPLPGSSTRYYRRPVRPHG